MIRWLRDNALPGILMGIVAAAVLIGTDTIRTDDPHRPALQGDAVAGAKLAATPPQQFDTGAGFDDVLTFCAGRHRVLITETDTTSSSAIAVIPYDESCAP